MSAPRTGGPARGRQRRFSDAAACAAESGTTTCDVRRAGVLRAMSRREPAANASSSGVAPRRSSTGSRGAERTAAEEPSRRGRVGSRRAGGGWREPAGAAAAAAAGAAAEATAGGRREPPLCFGVKNDVVGAVIGERGLAAARGALLGRAGVCVPERTSWKTRAVSVGKRGADERALPVPP